MLQREPRFGLATPGGMTSPQAPREGASRIQIQSPARRAEAGPASPSLRFECEASADRLAGRQARGGDAGAQGEPGDPCAKARQGDDRRGRGRSRRGGFGADRAGAFDVRRRAPRRAGVGRERSFPEAGVVEAEEPPARKRVANPAAPPKTGQRLAKEAQPKLFDSLTYQLPALMLLSEPRRATGARWSARTRSNRMRGCSKACSRISACAARSSMCGPGPVVTLYELEPAPGTKSSRVIGLADDIARSMSAVSARVAVVPGRNAIGIELPNQRRETVYLRELLGSAGFREVEAPARHRARQDDRRRAGDRRSRADAASARRRHHRLGQIGGDQHHDPVAALPVEAGGVPPDHGRSEDARTFRL